MLSSTKFDIRKVKNDVQVLKVVPGSTSVGNEVKKKTIVRLSFLNDMHTLHRILYAFCAYQFQNFTFQSICYRAGENLSHHLDVKQPTSGSSSPLYHSRVHSIGITCLHPFLLLQNHKGRINPPTLIVSHTATHLCEQEILKTE